MRVNRFIKRHCYETYMKKINCLNVNMILKHVMLFELIGYLLMQRRGLTRSNKLPTAKYLFENVRLKLKHMTLKQWTADMFIWKLTDGLQTCLYGN